MANGGQTIGMTAEGKVVELLTSGMPWPKARPFWNAASARFAAGASGDINVFQNAAGIGIGSIWAKTEFGILDSNPNVNIIYHVVVPTP